MYELGGELICEDELIPSYDYRLGAYWVDGDSLLFAVCSIADGEVIINIQKLQPTSDPLLLVVESFAVPFEGESCYFSPVSFHAAIVSWAEVIILDIRTLKILFQVKESHGYATPGYFSPDGRFFACGIYGNGISIWENTSTGYVPQTDLIPRLLWNEFSWSPTSTSILCWSDKGIQLLDPNSGLSVTSPIRITHPHLVAYTADQTHIATAHQWGSVVKFLSLSGATQQTVKIHMLIQDIKIVDNTIFVTDGRRFISWHLTTLGQAGGGCNTKRENKALSVHIEDQFALSNDCSQIAFVVKQTVFLYDVPAQKVLGDFVINGHIKHIQFSSDGSQLWSIVQDLHTDDSRCYHVELEREGNPYLTNMSTENLEGEWSLDSLFRSPHECQIVGNESEWVSDPRGNLLWLPPNWRVGRGWAARWDGNLLTLLGGQHPEPIIIEFQS